MSRICQITGKKAIVGNHVSHSNKKTKRKFHPNLFTKKFFNEADGSWVTLKVTAAGMRTIDKIGLNEAIKQAKEKGYYNN